MIFIFNFSKINCYFSSSLIEIYHVVLIFYKKNEFFNFSFIEIGKNKELEEKTFIIKADN